MKLFGLEPALSLFLPIRLCQNDKEPGQFIPFFDQSGKILKFQARVR
jgi:hypothetical protein